jgi:hypothetical protein
MQPNPLTPATGILHTQHAQECQEREAMLRSSLPPDRHADPLGDYEAVYHTDPYAADAVTTEQLWASLFGWLCAVAVIAAMVLWFGGHGR